MKFILTLLLLCSIQLLPARKTYNYYVSKVGLLPNSNVDASPIIDRLLTEIKGKVNASDKVVLHFEKGRYDFHPEQAATRVYYISNHDQDNPKRVGLAIESINNLTIEGNGAAFVFHGRMIPVSLIGSKNSTLKNFSIDFENPQIAQVQVVENSVTEGITFKVAPWVNYRISDNGYFETYGDGWIARQGSGIAFEEKTKHIVYNTSDIGCPTKGVTEVAPRTLRAPNWKDARLIPGTVIAMRTWARPTPGLFLYHNVNTKLLNIKVHYCEGMGLLAQMCDNITMDGFGVCLKGEDDPRYFTSQADATHFSGCKGKIISKNGLYEGMMDDAINVHGTYLKVTLRNKDQRTIHARYMHGQAWGFEWGRVGDNVQFVKSKTMELIGSENKITAIAPLHKKTVDGEKEFIIQFEKPLDSAIIAEEGFGVENLTWTPEVLFSGNTIRNNRARGSLFSTPRKTVVENNLFDHTSGCAILLCGDCNGWYETGACRDVVIRKNKFINALTNMFQFTNAVISIYPEIPDLKNQQKFFHGGKRGAIKILNNEFDTFDTPILYAKSVDGLVFKGNTILKNTEYPAFHWNKKRFFLERVINAEIEKEK
ncbi:MAG: alpha-1,3-galactosidase B [Bacteroidaceae bacterium]